MGISVLQLELLGSESTNGELQISPIIKSLVKVCK